MGDSHVDDALKHLEEALVIYRSKDDSLGIANACQLKVEVCKYIMIS